MRIIEYFEQTNEMQNNLRNRIVQGDWRAAKYLYEVLEQGELKERYGESTRLLLLVEDGEISALTETGQMVSVAERTEGGEETQVFEKRVRDERESCACKGKKGLIR